MNSSELHLQYRYAIQLIKGQRFAEAYDVLKVIDGERPNTKNVLYALAVCADALSLTDEALELCDRLILEFDHEKAKFIRDRILQGRTIRLRSLGDDSESIGLASSMTGLSSGVGTQGDKPAAGAEPRTETLWQAFQQGDKSETGKLAHPARQEGGAERSDAPSDDANEEGELRRETEVPKKKRSFFSWGE